MRKVFPKNSIPRNKISGKISGKKFDILCMDIIFLYLCYIDFIDMTKKEFKNEVGSISTAAVRRVDELLRPLELTVNIDWEYDFDSPYYRECIGVYEMDTVFSGEIRIGFNMDLLCKTFMKEVRDYPFSDPHTMLDELIYTNVYHEVGHGLVNLLRDYLEESDDLDTLYDANKELFDNVLDNEEEAVEEFAWSFYDNDLGESDLWCVVELYLGMCKDNGIAESYLGRVVDECISDLLLR